MLLSAAPNHDRGFTLIEILIVLFIAGILMAIGIPSFLASLNNKKVDNAIARVESALQESQREAIKKSKTCTVTIPTGVAPQLTSNCSASGDLSIEAVNISRPSSLATLTFDFKGRVNPGNQGTILISLPDGSRPQKCLAISSGIGLIRTGNYDGSNCNTL